MTPQEVADCLVQELWQMLRASLEAQARCRLTLPYVALVVTATSGHKEHGTTKASPKPGPLQSNPNPHYF